VIKEIEDALVDRVAAILEPFGFGIEPFPDNPNNYTMTHPNGVVLVVNKGSNYNPPETTSRAIQQRMLNFELTCLVRNLRKHQGAYQVIDALAYGLAGWKAPGAIFGSRLERDGFVERDATVWTWILQISIPVYLVPKPQNDALGANIAKITATSKGENVTVGDS